MIATLSWVEEWVEEHCVVRRAPLSELKVRRIRQAGLYSDGQGLFLQVTTGVDSVRKSWLVRFRSPAGKVREMGLGPFPLLDLRAARDQALAARRLAKSGIDPIEHREAQKAAAALAAARTMTFQEAAETYIAGHRDSWKNAKHKQQWTNTLKRYAYPIIGPVPVQAVDVALVTKVLDPIWMTKTETASRVRGRIETILDWAAVRGFRSGENPARWRGHLQRALPAPGKVRKVVHLPALHYDRVPEFMPLLRARECLSARALEFAILTACRANEAVSAAWSEIDLLKATWTIPPERMKAGREHRVPLAPRAIAILQGQRTLFGDEGFVFPSHGSEGHLTTSALLTLIRRLGFEEPTTHGFRSTFRDWVTETTQYSNETGEVALAHSVGDKVYRAYQRGDLFEKRRLLMAEWADYCERVVRLQINMERTSEGEEASRSVSGMVPSSLPQIGKSVA